jgi:hypothetical protein
VSAFHWPKNVNKPNPLFLHILECKIRNTFLTNINLGRLSDIASHCKIIYKYFIDITFLSHFCLFNTLFHVYPTTARMDNFARLVKHIFPNKDWLVPENSTFSILILICYYWSPDIGINKKGWSASRTETTA